jgi:cytochrome c556
MAPGDTTPWKIAEDMGRGRIRPGPHRGRTDRSRSRLKKSNNCLDKEQQRRETWAVLGHGVEFAAITQPRGSGGDDDWSESDMRAPLLSSVFPALALVLTACGQPETTDTADAASSAAPPAAAPSSPPPAEEPASTATATSPPAAPAADPAMERAQAAIELRQGAMKLVGWNMGPLGGMLRGAAPFDIAVVETNTTRISHIAPMLSGVFAADVRSSGLDSASLDAIWENKADFDMKAAALAEAATAAAAAAASGDEAATRAALGGIGQACGSCHDTYRAE